MSILLDTNIISEMARQTPHAGVIAFLQELDQAFLSVLTLHELHYGISRMPQGRRREDLSKTIELCVARFDDSIMAVNRREALKAAELRASGEAKGQVIHLADALIAATALEHGMALATRNVSDFAGFGVTLINPWDE